MEIRHLATLVFIFFMNAGSDGQLARSPYFRGSHRIGELTRLSGFPIPSPDDIPLPTPAFDRRSFGYDRRLGLHSVKMTNPNNLETIRQIMGHQTLAANPDNLTIDSERRRRSPVDDVKEKVTEQASETMGEGMAKVGEAKEKIEEKLGEAKEKGDVIKDKMTGMKDSFPNPMGK